jgi:thioredoxin 1
MYFCDIHSLVIQVLTNKYIFIMSKFGDIVNSDIPVLIDFHANWDEDSERETTTILKLVAAALGDKARVVKIDIDKNETLAMALRIKANPTYIIYKNSEMKWRQSGDQDANTLIGLVEQYI